MTAAARGAASQKIGGLLGTSAAAERGRQAAWSALGSAPAPASGEGARGSDTGSAPAWARQLRSEQAARHRRHVVIQSLKDGDRGGASITPDIKERD